MPAEHGCVKEKIQHNACLSVGAWRGWALGRCAGSGSGGRFSPAEQSAAVQGDAFPGALGLDCLVSFPVMEAKGLLGKECRPCNSYVKVGSAGALCGVLRALLAFWGWLLPSMLWAAFLFCFLLGLLCPALAEHPLCARRWLASPQPHGVCWHSREGKQSAPW